jgi:hypothetical protein
MELMKRTERSPVKLTCPGVGLDTLASVTLSDVQALAGLIPERLDWRAGLASNLTA